MIATGATNQTAGHEYRYLGRIIPKWQTGKNQRTAFIGTNIRTKYPGNPSQEGVVGCFVATKKRLKYANLSLDSFLTEV